MAKQSAGNKLDTAVKLAFIFFIALFSFAVGTFVGKQVSDSEHQAANFEQGPYAEFGRNVASDAETHENALSEEEIKSLTEEFVRLEKGELDKSGHGNEHGDTHEATEPKESHDAKNEHAKAHTHKETKGGHHPTTKESHETDPKNKHDKLNKADAHDEHGVNTSEHKEPEHKGSVAASEHASKSDNKESGDHGKADKQVSAAAERVASGKAPAKTEKKLREPSSALPSLATSAVGKYTVQVASYATEDEAKNHAAKLRTDGYSAFYVSAAVGGKNWYRVSVGLFASYKSATTFRGELLKQTELSSAIVQKIVK